MYQINIIYIYNIIKHVCVCMFVCLSVQPFGKLNASVEPGKARAWIGVANLFQMEFRQMKLAK